MSNSKRLELSPNEAHVWYLFPAKFSQGLEEQGFALMSSDERARHGRFHFAEGRREYLLTRALVRTTLSRYADVEPGDWRFGAGERGRPEIAPAMGVPLFFNLSNTEGLIACIVGLEPQIGIDVESINPDRATFEIADRYFSPSEAAGLRALPERDQALRFFELWTLKEAYIKARGLGVWLPLDQFSFELSGPDPTISFDPRMIDAPDQWQFNRLFPSAAHRVATAVRRGSTARLDVVERTTVPLAP